MIKESISSNLKQTLEKELAPYRTSMEGNISATDMLNSLDETKKKKKTPVIKRVIKKGNTEELVGNFPLNKPIGKMMSFKKSESNEATGAASSGQFSQPLFSEPKEKNKKVETKEATGSSSAGQYSTPKVWAEIYE